MFLLHCVFSAAAYVVGWIATIGIGGLFQAIGIGGLFQAIGIVGESNANPFLIPGLAIAVTNGIAASIACRRISSDGARWVWIPWALLIYYTYTNYPQAHTMGQHVGNVWHQVFSSHCGDTECLGQLFVGMPFVGSVVYAVTSVVVRWDAREAAAPHGS